MHRSNITIALILLLVIFSGLRFAHAAYRGRALNFTDPQGPRFEGGSSSGEVATDGNLIVASYNIRYGIKIPEAIRDIQSHEHLAQADILLLQEMDEIGTEGLAESLGFDYVYFPSAVHPRTGRNFGNAVLSKWPILEAEKLILPYESLWSGISRTATKASLEINGRKVVVYSIHLEYFLASQEQRQSQVEAILQDLDPGTAQVIIGGDFNTFGTNRAQFLDEQMASYALKRAHRDHGPTVRKSFFSATTDFIYIRGFSILESGIVASKRGSDHNPTWVRLVE